MEEGETIIGTLPGHPQESILIAEILITVPDLHHLRYLSRQLIIPWNHDRIHPRISTLNQRGRIPLPRHDMILDRNIRPILVRRGIMMITIVVNTILGGLLLLSHHHHHIPPLTLHHHLPIWIRGDHTIEMDMIEDQIQQITDELIPDRGIRGMTIHLRHHFREVCPIRDILLIWTHDIKVKVLITVTLLDQLFLILPFQAEDEWMRRGSFHSLHPRISGDLMQNPWNSEEDYLQATENMQG